MASNPTRWARVWQAPSNSVKGSSAESHLRGLIIRRWRVVRTEIEIFKIKFDVLLWDAHNHRPIAQLASKFDRASNSVDSLWLGNQAMS
jgi:hypothetical protein